MAQVRARNRSLVSNKCDPQDLKVTSKTLADYKAPNLEHNNKQGKNKIPKNVRYDLENALLGLCDLWFEDIKPHLMRNNIKLHVQEPLSGDAPEHMTEVLHGALLDCAHVDPGATIHPAQRPSANCVGCYLMQPTASKARCHRLHAPVPAQLVLSHSLDCHLRRASKHSLVNSLEKSPTAKKPSHAVLDQTCSPNYLQATSNNEEQKSKVTFRRKKKKMTINYSRQAESILKRGPYSARRYKTVQRAKNNNTNTVEEVHFHDDLINVIVEYDKRLQSSHTRHKYDDNRIHSHPAFVKSAQFVQKNVSMNKPLPPWK